MEEVREQMKRKPSKWRHLKDLQRQVDDRKRILSENSVIERNSIPPITERHD